jgi:hypothetical protein
MNRWNWRLTRVIYQYTYVYSYIGGRRVHFQAALVCRSLLVRAVPCGVQHHVGYEGESEKQLEGAIAASLRLAAADSVARSSRPIITGESTIYNYSNNSELSRSI